MASITTNTVSQERSIRERLDDYFANLGMGMNAYLDRLSRSDRVRMLEAKSDAELAELGIERQDIPRHVFRDVYWM